MDTLTLQTYFHSANQKQFLEYFVNDKPLSTILKEFFQLETSILENWTGALGAINAQVDIVKIKQLLGIEVSDEEIKNVYPSCTEEAFKGLLKAYREELANPVILIYCCPLCGDYYCGGIGITIDKTETLVRWIIYGETQKLLLEFDRAAYLAVFTTYLQSIT